MNYAYDSSATPSNLLGPTATIRPDYLQRLQNYADLVGMPLLIAWKFHSLWMFFEARYMKKADKNYKITMETAIR